MMDEEKKVFFVKIRRSAEDYLEMILMLRKKQQTVRSVDLAGALNVTKPSVSVAMKKLREQQLIGMEADNCITLTARGEEIAARIYERHNTLMSVLMSIGVDETTAREDACRMEHDISDLTYAKLLECLRRKGCC